MRSQRSAILRGGLLPFPFDFLTRLRRTYCLYQVQLSLKSVLILRHITLYNIYGVYLLLYLREM